MIIHINCPKCKKENMQILDFLEQDTKKICTCVCTKQFVFEYSIDVQVTQPPCLYGCDENHEMDSNGYCTECGYYNSKFDGYSVGSEMSLWKEEK